jgi:hypothetical protein
VNVTRQRIMIGLLAAALVFAGGLVGVERLNACDGCSAHAKAQKVESVKSAAAEKTDAEVTQTNVTKAGCAATCTMKKVNQAKLTGDGATCHLKKADAKTASSKQWCADKKAHAKGELMTAEATLSMLAHCGIDVRTADVEVLSAKLADADKGCCDFTQKQWATMIKSAQAIDAEEAEALFADASKGEPCKSEDCPMALVARDLTTDKAESENN